MAYGSKVHFTESTEFTVESGGEIAVESGGYIDVASGGYIKYPVAGATSGNVSGSSDAATPVSNGFLYVLGAGSTQHYDLAAPHAGASLDIYVSAPSTGCAKVFDAGSGVTFDSTNRYGWMSSTNFSGTSIGHLRLVGHSTTYWMITERTPSTYWEFGATTA